MSQNQFFYPINTPLVNYFFYNSPLTQNGPNVPLAGGFLFFFADADHTIQLDTYSDITDPANPTVNPNPLPLGSAGQCPLFYLLNQPYYIVITDSSQDLQNPIDTIDNYDPAKGTSDNQATNLNGNILANAQFAYPIEFWQTDQTPGEITNPITTVAWAWQFLQDQDTTTENTITFNNVSQEDIEGSPIFEINLTSNSPMSTEQTKDYRAFLGPVNFLAGLTATFAGEFINYISGGNTSVQLLIEKNYGIGGSDSELIPVDGGQFQVSDQREKKIVQFTLPTNAGKSIGLQSYVALHIRFALGQVVNIGFTNAQELSGTIDNPTFVEVPFNQDASQIIGASTRLNGAGLERNYAELRYANGQIIPYADTGTMVIAPVNAPQAFRLPCDGSELLISEYTNSIPNRRLYEVIGNTYGGSGDLIVTSSNNIIKFDSGIGAIQNSPYTAGTTNFIVTNTIAGLKLGVSTTITSPMVVRMTWNDDFAPLATPPNNVGFDVGQYVPPPGALGNWFAAAGITTPAITAAVVNAGSGVAQAVVDITFVSENITDYGSKYYKSNGSQSTMQNFFDFATISNNTRGTAPGALNQFIRFCPDGVVNGNLGGQQPLNINYSSTSSIPQLMNIFSKTVSNPFEWTVQVVLPIAASAYFTFSSISDDFYVWYKVDGIGTDPTPGGTPVEVDISSSDDAATVAAKTAAATNNLTFLLPDQSTDLPTIPGSPALSQWYINQ